VVTLPPMDAVNEKLPPVDSARLSIRSSVSAKKPPAAVHT